MKRYASVVLLHPSLVHRDRDFTYGVPAAMDVRVGSLVRAPLGRKRATGVVVGLLDEPDVSRTVDLIAALGPGVDEPSVEMARWLASRYCSSLGEALAAVMPERVASEESGTWPGAEPAGAADLAWLRDRRGGPSLARAVSGAGPGSFSFQPSPFEDRGPLVASLARAAFDAGRGVLVLLPEIAFRSQVAAALDAEMKDRVAWLGSDRSARERYRAWLALRRGEARVAAGGRSAVFAPVPDLGLIVVDDESHVSYKGRRQPRFHARTVAAERARLTGATLVAVGVPPSIEVAAAVSARRMTAVTPPAGARRRVPVEIVDSSKTTERHVPSGRTIAAIKATLAAGERALVLMHRGGEEPARVFERTVRTVGPSRPALLDSSSGAAAVRSALARSDLIVASPVVAKDLPLPALGLAAVCHADAALSDPDFRTAEEAFATWWRTARFAGRILLETADPSHDAVRALVRFDPEVLAAAEIRRRRELGYPPFGGLARIACPPDQAAAVGAALEDAGGLVLGPVERDGVATLAVRAGSRAALESLLSPLAAAWRAEGAHVRVDVDPREVLS